MVEVMIFDAGDVLVERNESVFVWAVEQLQNVGWEGNLEQFVVVSREIAGVLSKGGSEGQIQKILQQKNIPAILDYRALEVRAYWNNLHPEAKEVLSGLKDRGVKLGILTDSVLQETEVNTHLKGHGILQYLDAVVTSATLHHVKPEPEAYLEILSRLDTTPNRTTAFVGHSEDEILGAKELGMLTIEYLPTPSGLADYHVSRLRDLLTLCEDI